MYTPTLLTISGSLRLGSTNRLLLSEAVRLFGTCHRVDGDLRLPLYDGDLEADGIPVSVQTLADQVSNADAVIIATPEYNKALSGVLKNALDWISRTKGAPWRDKPVAIMSAAAGRAGGERAQSSLRLCLIPFRPLVLAGPEILVASSATAFAADGLLTNPVTITALQELMDNLRATVAFRQDTV
jgi:chromate reductase